MKSLVILLTLSALIPSPDDAPTVCKDGGYSIRWPATPTEEIIKEMTSQGEVDNHYFHADLGDGLYSVQYADFPMIEPRRLDVQKSLDATIDAFAAQKYYRVLSRRPITLDGVPGREIEFEVKGDRLPSGNRGRARAFLDKQRFHQVIVLGDKAFDSPKAKGFFESFRLGGAAVPASLVVSPGDPNKPWELFTTQGGKFSIQMPAGPAETSKLLDPEGGPRKIHVIQAVEGSMNYVVTVTDVDPASISSPKALLDSTRDLVVRGSKGKLVSEKKVEIARNPGREFSAEIARGEDPRGGLIRGRIYLMNRKVYQVMAVGPRDAPDSKKAVDRFLNSFRPAASR